MLHASICDGSHTGERWVDAFQNYTFQTPGVPALGHRGLLPELPGPVGRADPNCLSSLKWPAAAQMWRDSTFCTMLSDCGLAELWKHPQRRPWDWISSLKWSPLGHWVWGWGVRVGCDQIRFVMSQGIITCWYNSGLGILTPSSHFETSVMIMAARFRSNISSSEMFPPFESSPPLFFF